MNPDRPGPLRSVKLHRPTLGPEEAQAIADVLASGQLVQGPRVLDFERALAGRIGTAHAVACSSGTAALHLVALVLGIGPGDEVIVPDYTFPATAAAFVREGASAVLVDVDPTTANTTAAAVRDAFGDRTRAVVLVHQFGLPAADTAAIAALCQERGVPLVEDAACALGASLEHGGRWHQVGTLGRFGCFSFHPRKAITTAEGGLVTTADPTADTRLRLLRNHGMVQGGASGTTFVEAGLNYRLTELQAAMGLVQLGRMEDILQRRRMLATRYRSSLADRCPEVGLPPDPGAGPHTWQTFLITLPPGVARADVQALLASRGIESSVGAHCLHRQPLYRHPAGDPAFPGATALGDRGLALPLHAGLGPSEVDTVVDALRRTLDTLRD